MIDLSKETLISAKEVSKFFPPGRRGKRPHRSTIYRWCIDGVKGVRLESVVLPSGRATSKEAIGRFLEALTELKENQHPNSAPTAPTINERRREIEAANRKLDALGIC
jgi:Protein of unknown function (DUF1580)